MEDKSGSWGEISPPGINKVKVSLDVLTVGGSNYKQTGFYIASKI